MFTRAKPQRVIRNTSASGVSRQPPRSAVAQCMLLTDRAGNEREDLDVDNTERFLSLIHRAEKAFAPSPITFLMSLLGQMESDSDSYRYAGIMAVIKAKIQSLISETLWSESIEFFAQACCEYFFLRMVMENSYFTDTHLPAFFTDAARASDEMIQHEKDIQARASAGEDIGVLMSQMTRFREQLVADCSLESMALAGHPKRGLALMATGSFGREECVAASDIDFGYLGDDSEHELITRLKHLTSGKLYLARQLAVEKLGLKDVNYGYGPDMEWLKDKGSFLASGIVRANNEDGNLSDTRVFRVLGTEDYPSKAKARTRNYASEFEASRLKHYPKEKHLQEQMRWLADSKEPTDITENNRFDIKDRCLRLLTIGAQQLSLLFRLNKTNTRERLQALKAKNIMPADLCDELERIFLRLCHMRNTMHLKHHDEADHVVFGEDFWLPAKETIDEATFREILDMQKTLRRFAAILKKIGKDHRETFKGLEVIYED
ncbi:hypothetical protein FUAX_50660 (plasmid) [Fulvitalea axinellae]|uniref:Uncharacterized protein n=2 Tax=Fulvitalea axinellae TaxID=1182444 RepID=A0AAU9DDX9_9BACT|nr:hypothetical protein FUAX_50660 [Fulvitalea axinellae]